MATTYALATWYQLTEQATVRRGIEDALGGVLDKYDVDAIEEEYRDFVSEALPSGTDLVGDEVHAEEWRDPDEVRPAVLAAIEEVPFWTIVEGHAR